MAKQPRFVNPNAHRPVNWNERAVKAALDSVGYVYVQAKEDGLRFHAFLYGDEVKIVTREGIEIRSLVEHKEVLRPILTNCLVVDGEVLVPGRSFEESSGMLRRHAALEETPHFYVWDTFPLAALLGDEYNVEYGHRLSALVYNLEANAHLMSNTSIVQTQVCWSLDEIHGAFAWYRSLGKEGAIVKQPDLHVRHGKVNGQWKLKPEETHDGKIIGYVWGTPGLANEGKIIGFTVELENGVQCDVTGITQEQMDEFTAEYIRKAAVASMAGPFAYMGRYCEIKAMEQTAGGSLRHPSFVRFRDMDYAPGVKA